MSVWQLSSMTWEEVRDLDRARTVVVLPIGAIEAHGPHLPLATDVVISEAMARAGAQRLNDHGHDVVVLPTISYTPAGFAAGFQGTVSIEATTLRRLLLDIARSLAEQGFTNLAIANSHLDPSHLSVVTEFAMDPDVEIAVVFPNLTRQSVAERLTEEFQSGACHAGQFETSIVQAEMPDLVRDEIRERLEPNPISLSDAIREGATDFKAIGGGRAYFGSPAEATPSEGKATVESLGAILADSVLEALDAA